MFQGRDSRRGGRKNHGKHYNKNKINVGDKGKEILQNIEENNSTIKQFQVYAAELDSKHDRFERIVKISRDVTIESKRIIFLLHSIDKESKREAILSEAKLRLDTLAKVVFKKIAQELEGQDSYQYLRAYRSGMEEYVEAVTFFQYIQSGSMQGWVELEKSLTYNIVNDSNVFQTKTLKAYIFPYEYVLGIADLTGELMRKCINNLAMGDIASSYHTCSFVREMYKCFLGCSSNSNKEISRKLFTLRQSLAKMENVCYAIKVRGSEIPKYMLADVAIVAAEEFNADDDEGFSTY